MTCQTIELDHSRLKTLLSYDAASGVFAWLEDGRQAGCQTPKGYVVIGIDGSLYLAHRLAWLYVTGSWPEMRLDHKDRNKANNRRNNVIISLNGESLTMAEYCRKHSLNSDKVQQRLKRGYSVERAVQP